MYAVRCSAAVVLLLLPSGCAPRWRPSLDGVIAGPAGLGVELRDYLAPVGTTRAFTRRDLFRPDEPALRFIRRTGDDNVVEGRLIDRLNPADLAKLSPDGGEPFADFEWPEINDGFGAAFFLEFDPPVPSYPPLLATGLTLIYESAVRYYDWRGRYRNDATARRTVVFEGFESVGDHPDCLRLRMETEFDMGWGTRIRVTEYVWLARGIGEIERIERFHGFALWLPFEAAYEYTLADNDVRPSAAPGQPAGPWRRCAVFLDRTFPRPRLAGLAVELTHQPRPTQQAPE